MDILKNKTLLITGGTGSFGNTLVKELINSGLKEIRIFSRDEKKQDDMRQEYMNDRIKYYIGDVRSYDSLEHAMKNVNFVFHAAALKQVPTCEFFPIEAVNTNILGANNVLNAAVKNDVEKVVVLSTDKAVYPINAMGISKAMMEKLMISKSRELIGTKQIFCATRYGNVMGSRGSVIPLFIKQIKEGIPLTVTNPAMTRFMMSLQQSVELVLFAFTHSQHGDIFVQKAPASTILDLALALKNIFHANNEIRIIGSRHGEKIYETLCSKEEMAKVEDLGNFYRIPSDQRDLNYNKYLINGEIKIDDVDEDYTSHNTKRLSVLELEELLLDMDFIRHELHSN